jgi:hypothetical protein
MLPKVMKIIATEMNWPKPLRVGENRHFPRLWLWLCEVCEDSWTSDGYAVRVINTSGNPPAWPLGPGNLRLRVDPDLI